MASGMRIIVQTDVNDANCRLLHRIWNLMVFTLRAHFLPLSALTAEIAKFCFTAGRQR